MDWKLLTKADYVTTSWSGGAPPHRAPGKNGS